ncbi:cilium assembly protein DZIP1L isoform X5 [Canis lupus baileyi]|uniref:cilium assembly protein DZIP1L isoform X5 n=1 Tax=Canis lupus baileyi TaxID=143281 RepID=UPI003B96BADC
MQYSATTAKGLNGPLFGAYPFPPFKFQLRSENVDWRRISALDMDRVVRELDVATLQENIIHVTFCSLDQEVCHRCGQPLDPALLKLVRLAQLIIEYLLHCQNCLSTSITQLESRLQASLSQQEKGRQELERQAQEFKSVKEESRQRRKLISTLQQLLLQTGVYSYHPCDLCDKAFTNVTFLQGHMQRKHLNMAEGAKQKPERLLEEDVLEELRAKLKWTQEELEAQREAEKRRQLQEAEVSHQKEIETKKKFDEWKEKEWASLYEEIDKFKRSLWDEFKSVAKHNSMLEEKLQMLQSQSHSMVEANIKYRLDKSGEHFKQSQEIQALKEKVDIQEKLMQTQEVEVLREKTDIEKLQMLQSQSHSMVEANLRLLLDESQVQVKQSQELQALKEKMIIQKTEWKRKMKELQKEHAAQKRELQEQKERLQAYMFEDQQKAAAQSQQQINALHDQLQKYASCIASQKQTIWTMSLRKKEGTCKGPKAVEPEDSSSEDLKNSRGDQQKMLASLRPDPTLLKVRSILEKTLEKKLEIMGIAKNKKRISTKTLQQLKPFLRFQQVQNTQKYSEFLSLRVQFDKEVTSKAKKKQKKERTLRFQLDTKAPVKRQQSPKVIKEAQPKPKPKTRPVALASRRAEVPVKTRQSLKGHGPGLAQVPAPILHQRAHGHFGSPASQRPGLSTSPFSLEEDSEGNSEERTFLQPQQDTYRKRPQSRASWGYSDIESLKESPQPPDKSSGGLASSAFWNLPSGSRAHMVMPWNLFLSVFLVKRQRGPKVIKEAQPKPKPKTRPVELPSMVTEVPMETLQSPGLAQVPAPILHQRAHGHFGSPASQRPGLSTSPFSLEEDSEGNSEERTFLQPVQDTYRKRPQSRAGWECSDIESLKESPQPPDKSSGGLASSETLVQSIAKNFEQELEVPVKKPDGGIKLFLKSKRGPQSAAVPETKLQLSDDESDLSSLIEFFKTRGQKEEMKPLEMFSTSPWSPM